MPVFRGKYADQIERMKKRREEKGKTTNLSSGNIKVSNVAPDSEPQPKTYEKKESEIVSFAKNLIKEEVLDNTDLDATLGDHAFDTSDLISIPSRINLMWYYPNSERICYPTEFVTMQGATLSSIKTGPENLHSCKAWLRSIARKGEMECYPFKIGDELESQPVYGYSDYSLPFCPQMKLKADVVKEVMSKSGHLFNLGSVKDFDGNTLYHTIAFGEYPQIYYNGIFLEGMKTDGVPTGREYICGNNFGMQSAKEYVHYVSGKKVPIYFVKMDTYPHLSMEEYDMKRGEGLPKGVEAYAIVKPIQWIIRNWDELPKDINPIGSGQDDFLDLVSARAITNLPFVDSSEYTFGKTPSLVWEDSLIRKYLNGLDKFSENNFISQALYRDLVKIKDLGLSFDKEDKKEGATVDKSKRKGYGVKVMDKPMSIDEQIKFYVDKGQPFMLHGASGIGKTQRIAEIDPDYVGVMLRNGMLPEEIMGKTIYPNNDTTASGIWKPPVWYSELCRKCEEEPDRNHILFIDEITNVKDNVQSLVFHIVLNNSIGPNMGKLPNNTVVVAAGNSKEESDAAYNMPEPLFRRFAGHIYLPQDISSWIDWGMQPNSEDGSRDKVHPVVRNFVATFGDDVFYTKYDSEEPPRYATDSRGWTQISDIIYDNDGLIAKELIANKVGDKIASSFVEFASNPPPSVMDIISGNYDNSDIPVSPDGRYALAMSLLGVEAKDVDIIRSFISSRLGNEILNIFDNRWVGKDVEKAIYLSQLKKIEESSSRDKQDAIRDAYRESISKTFRESNMGKMVKSEGEKLASEQASLYNAIYGRDKE